MKINILGTEYNLVEQTREENTDFTKLNCDGYCDNTSKTIAIRILDENDTVDDFETYMNTIKRHEIIHAFMFESGLGQNWKHQRWGHEETTVDWFARQFSKIQKIFEEVGCS